MATNARPMTFTALRLMLESQIVVRKERVPAIG